MLPWWYVLIILQFWPMDAPPEIWSYDDTTQWNKTFLLCSGPLQSPIALNKNRVVASLPPKVVAADGLPFGEVEATNTGRHIKLVVRPANRSAPALQLVSYKKPLFGAYNLAEVVLHWGDALGTHGSEHAIGGNFLEAEAQLVFYNNFYKHVGQAKRHPGGLAVVAVLLRGAEKPSQPLLPTFGLEDRLDELAAPGSRVTLPADLTPLHTLVSGAVNKVFSYYGGLTSPPCNPVATWLVSATETAVSGRLLRGLVTKIFQDEAMTKPLVNNWRPLQEQKGRVVVKQLAVGGRPA